MTKREKEQRKKNKEQDRVDMKDARENKDVRRRTLNEKF